jgi:hypothetical protein
MEAAEADLSPFEDLRLVIQSGRSSAKRRQLGQRTRQLGQKKGYLRNLGVYLRLELSGRDEKGPASYSGTSHFQHGELFDKTRGPYCHETPALKDVHRAVVVPQAS